MKEQEKVASGDIWQESNFPQYDHRTSSIFYEAVTEEQFEALSSVFKKGWSLGNIDSIERNLYEADVASKNFKVVTEDGRKFLLKKTINSPQRQTVINSALIHAEAYGVPAPHIFKASDGKTFFENDGENKVYCLYEFIDSRHYNGSQEDLISVAQTLPLLFDALDTFPDKEAAIASGGSAISHPKEKLFELISTASQKRGNSSGFNQRVIKNSKDIIKASNIVSNAAIDTIPQGVVHLDLHPHNILFDKSGNGKLLAIIDWDEFRLSQRVRGTAFAWHRFTRGYGKDTEDKYDMGVSFLERSRLFLNNFQSRASHKLSEDEIVSFAPVLMDESLRRITILLNEHYNGQARFDYDLGKQLTIFKEAYSFYNFQS